jgi:hypothetical protein
MLMTSRYDCTRDVHLFGQTIHIGHDVKDMLKGHWLIAEQFFTPFHINTIKYDLFLFHILRLLHFSDNMNQPDKNDNNYDKL